MKLFNRFLKTILLFLFMPPLIAFASCVEADAVKLMKENLTPRIQFLRQENVLPTFQKVTEEKEKHLIKAYEKKDWEGVCKGFQEYIAIADDILSGGNGQNKPFKTPWKQCTPEKFLALEKAFQSMCLSQPNKNCAKDELIPLTQKLTQLAEQQKGPQVLKPAVYVDQLCETLTDIIKLVKE